MEEKERYEIHIYDDVCVDLYDNGVLDKSINDTYKLEELLNQQDKRIKELEEENQQLKQSQKQLAIEELEKVKENIKKVPITDYDLSGNFEKMYKQDAIRQIDNQIKQLKGENK